MLRAVLFDLDGTLLPHEIRSFMTRYLERLRAWSIETLGVDYVAPTMDCVPRLIENDGAQTNGQLLWSHVSSVIGADSAALQENYAAFIARHGAWLAEGITADPVARGVVVACASAGKRVALATNPLFPRCMLDARLRWGGLEPDMFGLITSLDDSRFCKPNPEYYRQIAADLGVAPEECLMVGNDVAMDLKPAAHTGMTTFLVNNGYHVLDASSFAPHHLGSLEGVLELLVGN